ncbi:MAG: DEAD/DEAH box helicase [Parabacteroides sp.]|nr:DEAD/DEAH box helicase [Parabacteroides sp.]
MFRHQRVALSRMRVYDGYALFMEQGTSKTYPALCRILDLLKSGSIEDALIVGTKTCLGAWERDLAFFDPADQDLLKEKISLINYDKVWRKDKASPYYKKWGAIILDESHNIKNRTTNRAKFLLRIGCEAKYHYILTGTPIGNGSLEDIYSQFCFLDPYMDRGNIYSNIFKREWEERSEDPEIKFKGSYREFLDRYCLLDMYYNPCSYKRVAELQDIVDKYSYRVKKIECLDLPDKLPDELYHLDLIPKAKPYYKELVTYNTIESLEILAENPLVLRTKLRQLASGYFTDNDGKIHEVGSEKIKALEEFLDGYDDKLVIFAQYTHSIDAISKLLIKRKVKFVTLDGRQKDKNIWKKFQEDDKIRIIVCQYESANAGIDLYASSTILYFEPTDRSMTLEQSRDRIHRTGQKKPCSYIHFITKGTVEVAIYKALSNYQDFNEKLFTEYMDFYQRKYDTTRR